MSTTIKDISIAAGVSYSTVSRAINNTGRISDKTRGRIIEIANKLHYVPNISARSLVTDKSYTICIFAIKERVQTTTFYEILEGIHDIIGLEYSLVFKKLEREEELNQILRLKRYDGIVLFSSLNSDMIYINRMKQESCPCVVINRKMDDNHFINVVTEDDLGAAKATEHLIKLGHKRIAYIEGPDINVVAPERLAGYRMALEKNGIPYDGSYVVSSNGMPDGGYAAMSHLLRLKMRPTAVFTYSDPVAMGAMRAIVIEGLNIPRDIAIVGFDNMVSSQFLVPALTSIDKPRTEMGRCAARMLLRVLNGEKLDNKFLKLETRLVIRESCGALSPDFL